MDEICETDLLDQHPTIPRPENRRSFTEEELADYRRHKGLTQEYIQLVRHIRVFAQQPKSGIERDDVTDQYNLTNLLDQAYQLAVEICKAGENFAVLHPGALINKNTGQAWTMTTFSATCREAYNDRLHELDELTESAGRLRYVGTPVSTHGRIKADEGVNYAHLFSDHVGKKLQELRQRFRDQPGRKVLSSFFAFEDKVEQEAFVQGAVSRALQFHRQTIKEWVMAGENPRFRPVFDDLHDLGYYLRKNGEPKRTKRLKLVLVRDVSRRDGYRVHTAMLGEDP